jgi:1-phosphatidylinositol-4-phosphate 5-kinase
MFNRILEYDGITKLEVKRALIETKNRESVFKAGEGSGKSGSFFFTTFDKKFLIKTLRGDEKQVLLDMLEDYVEHIELTSG